MGGILLSMKTEPRDEAYAERPSSGKREKSGLKYTSCREGLLFSNYSKRVSSSSNGGTGRDKTSRAPKRKGLRGKNSAIGAKCS